MSKIFMRTIIITAAIASLVASAFYFLSTPDISREEMAQKYSNESSKFIDWGNGDIVHYRDEGNAAGHTLILIHGSNASLQTWEPWVSLLKNDYRLISVDLPGHGLTGAMHNNDYQPDTMAKFIIELSDRLELENIVLAGNSMGGAVSLEVALKKPALVKGLILVSSAGMRSDVDDDQGVGAFRLARSALGREILRRVTPRSIVKDTLEKIVADPANFVTEERVDLYWDMLRMEGTRDANLIRFAGYAKRQPLDDQLSMITAPTLILWGNYDTLIKPKYGERMQKAISGSQLIIYENAGHMAMDEIPEETATDARRFLSALN